MHNNFIGQKKVSFMHTCDRFLFNQQNSRMYNNSHYNHLGRWTLVRLMDNATRTRRKTPWMPDSNVMLQKVELNGNTMDVSETKTWLAIS